MFIPGISQKCWSQETFHVKNAWFVTLEVNQWQLIQSIFSWYFQESDVEGIDIGIADMYIDDPIAEVTPALQDLAHQRAWENGEIDYRGRDKFDNIQKRIEEFIGVLREPTDMPTFLVV